MAVTLSCLINKFLSPKENCGNSQSKLLYGPRRVCVTHQDSFIDHFFHRSCIEKWVCDLGHSNCPLCQRNIIRINGQSPLRTETGEDRSQGYFVIFPNSYTFDDRYFITTDDDLKSVENSREVSICNATQITDRGIGLLPETTRVLNLSNCSGLTDALFDHLPPNISDLNIARCPGISLITIFEFRMQRPEVEITIS